MKQLTLLTGLLFLCLLRGFAQSAIDVPVVGITVSDLEKSLRFYTEVLPFEKESEYVLQGSELARLYNFPGENPKVSVVRLRLGDERIELMQFGGTGTPARAIPADSRSNDLWFQHLAIVVSDMQSAYQWLKGNKVTYVSSSPQTLPDYLPNAAGISAFYFRDPDGHNLELIHFPAGKGNPKWQRVYEPKAAGPKPDVFLGIDHTAIGIDDTDAELAFYRDLLGLVVGGASENYGTEQEHLNQVFGAHLQISGLHAQNGIGVEFLDYLAPQGGRPYPAKSKASDLWHWQTCLQVADLGQTLARLKSKGYKTESSRVVHLNNPQFPFRKAVLVRDADRHAVLLGAQ